MHAAASAPSALDTDTVRGHRSARLAPLTAAARRQRRLGQSLGPRAKPRPAHPLGARRGQRSFASPPSGAAASTRRSREERVSPSVGGRPATAVAARPSSAAKARAPGGSACGAQAGTPLSARQARRAACWRLWRVTWRLLSSAPHVCLARAPESAPARSRPCSQDVCAARRGRGITALQARAREGLRPGKLASRRPRRRV